MARSASVSPLALGVSASCSAWGIGVLLACRGLALSFIAAIAGDHEGSPLHCDACDAYQRWRRSHHTSSPPLRIRLRQHLYHYFLCPKSRTDDQRNVGRPWSVVGGRSSPRYSPPSRPPRVIPPLLLEPELCGM